MYKIIRYIVFIFLTFTFFSCEKWYSTDDVSKISYLPEFEIIGGEFVSMIGEDSATYTDPGVNATVEGKPVNWYRFGEVDPTTPGVYLILYYAENEDGFYNIGQRVVAVTYEDVSNNDLSGTYTGTLWDPVEALVVKLDDGGLYKSSEIMGYPGAEMPGRFVDIGQGNLVLLPDEGDFGNYDASEGNYSRSTLSWSVILLDDPYRGIEIPVLWRKQ